MRLRTPFRLAFGPLVTHFLCSLDTMILAYRHAYEGGSSFGSPAEFDSDMHAASHALIRLALIVMGRFIA